MIDKIFYMLDFKGNISQDPSTLKRHIIYGEKLSDYSNNRSSLLLITLNNEIESISEVQNKGVRILMLPKKDFNLAKFIVFAIGSIREKIQEKHGVALICGNPWESYVISRIISIYFWSLPIQVQLHADIFDRNWLKLSYINPIKLLFSYISMKKASNLRVVSNQMSESLNSKFRIDRRKIWTTPVPLNIDLATNDCFVENRPRNIGVLSRLHHERNLEYILKFIAKLNQEKIEFGLLVAGTGPKEAWFQKELVKILGCERVKFCGELIDQELKTFWENVGLLLSPSKSESYGRSVREALYYGIPVWCFENSGTRDLFENTKNSPVFKLREDFMHYDIGEEFNKIVKMRTSNSFQTAYKDQIKFDLETLFESWEQLIP